MSEEQNFWQMGQEQQLCSQKHTHLCILRVAIWKTSQKTAYSRGKGGLFWQQVSGYTSLVPFQGVLQTDGPLGSEKVSINSKAALVRAVPETPRRDIYLNCGVIDTLPVSKSSCGCSQPGFNFLGSPPAPYCAPRACWQHVSPPPGRGWNLPT